MGYTTIADALAGREVEAGTYVAARGEAASATGVVESFVGSNRVRDVGVTRQREGVEAAIEASFPENEAALREGATDTFKTGGGTTQKVFENTGVDNVVQSGGEGPGITSVDGSTTGVNLPGNGILGGGILVAAVVLAGLAIVWGGS